MSSRTALSQLTLPVAPSSSSQAATKGYVDGLRGAANGMASLDSGGRIPVAQLPTPMARYRQDTTGQSIAAATDTRVQFNTALETFSGITYTSSGTSPPAGQFLINLAGKWTHKVRLVYPFTASLESWLWLGPSSTPTTTRWDLDTFTANAGSGPPTTLRCEITRVYAVNDTVSAWTWHNSGTAKTLDVSYGGVIHFEAIYHGPA